MAAKDTARGQILEYLERVKDEIIDLATKKNMIASGKTLASLQVIPSNTGGKLVAAANIIYLEDGRGPTHPTGPYMHPPEGSLEKAIAAWADAKGLTINAYAAAKTIHEKGTKLFRAGGHSGVLSIPLNGAGLNDLYAEIATMYRQEISSQIYQPIRDLQNA